MAKNNNLHAAKTAKNDEFYTQLSDIEKELNNYKDFFKDKVVYCNCDDPRESNFFKFFSLNFERLGLKKLITTGYKVDGNGVAYIYEGDKNGNRMVDDNEVVVTELQGDGSYDSEECIEFLKQADVVVTNPPFSLFRDYVKQLMDYGKKFLIIGNKNAITYKEIFPYIKNNQLWCGVRSFSGGMWFVINDETDCNTTKVENNQLLGNVASCWFTNIPHTKRNTPIDLYRKYNEKDFPKYDNYNAIECGKVNEIPEDYYGVIGVPITFLDKYCPTQFEIVDAREVALYNKQKNKQTYLIKDADGSINGKNTYARICIKRIS